MLRRVKWELHRSCHYQLSKTDRLRSLPSRRAFREFHGVHSYVLHIRYGADQSNGNFFIIPPPCEKLSLRRFRVRSPWLECFAEYYFRISIRTLNSNDHFTLSQLPFSLSLSLSLLVSIELWSKHIFQRLLSLNILSKCFSFITHCTNANSFEPIPNSMPTAFSPSVLSSRTGACEFRIYGNPGSEFNRVFMNRIFRKIDPPNRRPPRHAAFSTESIVESTAPVTSPHISWVGDTLTWREQQFKRYDKKMLYST